MKKDSSSRHQKKQERKKDLLSKEADNIPSKDKLEQSKPTLRKHSHSAGVSNKRSRPQCKRKKYSDLTNDELVNLCHRRDRPGARRVVDELRNYLIQASESKGFDIDAYPGYLHGVTTITPAKQSNNCLLGDASERMAKRAIRKYNRANKETSYKVDYVKQINEYATSCGRTYYITFCARDVKKANGDSQMVMIAAPLMTFQAIVKVAPVFGITYVPFCRLKPN